MTNENTNQNCQLLSAKALSKLLQTSVRSIWRYRSSGKLPKPVKIGGAIRWSAQECADWLAAGAPDRRTWESMKNAGNE